MGQVVDQLVGRVLLSGLAGLRVPQAHALKVSHGERPATLHADERRITAAVAPDRPWVVINCHASPP